MSQHEKAVATLYAPDRMLRMGSSLLLSFQVVIISIGWIIGQDLPSHLAVGNCGAGSAEEIRPGESVSPVQLEPLKDTLNYPSLNLLVTFSIRGCRMISRLS